jgi:hypothetical protein
MIDVPVTLSVEVRGVSEEKALELAREYAEALCPSEAYTRGYSQVIAEKVPGVSITYAFLASPSEEDCEVLEAVEEDTEDEGPWFVGIYFVCRSYGGPEEGGWWYDSGELAISDGAPEMKEFSSLEEAKAFLVGARIAAETITENYGPGLGGKYLAELHEGSLPAFYPEERPRYE